MATNTTKPGATSDLLDYDPLKTVYSNYSAASTPDYPGASLDGGSGLANGTNPLGGFASRYQPGQLANIWSSPWTILPDVFPGLNTAGGGYQSLRDIGADPLSLYNLMAGQRSDLAGGNAEGDFANWLSSLYKNLGTVGGRSFSGRELLSALFNPEANSALENILTAGDAGTQIRSIFNLARDASNVGLNPLAARGYQAALSRAGDTALNQMMTSDAGDTANNIPVYQLLRQIAPGLVPSG